MASETFVTAWNKYPFQSPFTTNLVSGKSFASSSVHKMEVVPPLAAGDISSSLCVLVMCLYQYFIGYCQQYKEEKNEDAFSLCVFSLQMFVSSVAPSFLLEGISV